MKVLYRTHLFLMGLVQYLVEHETLSTCCHVGQHAIFFTQTIVAPHQALKV